MQITGIDDKRQITAVLAATKTGNFLPIQVIYKGKMKRCLPLVDFPEDWLITCTENYWANVKQQRKELKLHSD